MFVRTFFMTGRRADPERLLPIFLNRRRKLVQPREERCDLPHVLLAERFIPCGHAAVADAGSDSVKNVPLGIIERLEDKLRRGRILGMGQQARLVVEPAVTPRAVHRIQLHAVDNVVVGRGHWVVYPRRMALHGSIQRTHGDPLFPARRSGICIGVHKT